MICINGNAAPVPSATQLLKVADVANRLGVSTQRARRVIDAQLSEQCITQPSGHRLVPESALLQFMGVEQEPDEAIAPHAVIIARSSNPKQARKGENKTSQLESQVELCRKWIKKNMPKGMEVVEYSQVRSSVNFSDKQFQQMMLDFISGQHRGCTVVMTTPCRLGRLGTQFLEFIITKVGGAEIVYVDPTMESGSSDMDSDIQAVLDTLLHFSAVRVGRRTKLRYERVLDSETLKRAWEIHHSGHGIHDTARILRKEGYTTPNGVISEAVLRKNLKQNWKMLEKLYPSSKIETTFTAWAKVTLKKAKGKKVLRKEMADRYRAYCKRNKIQPVNDTQIGYNCRRVGLKRVRINREYFIVDVAYA